MSRSVKRPAKRDKSLRVQHCTNDGGVVPVIRWLLMPILFLIALVVFLWLSG